MTDIHNATMFVIGVKYTKLAEAIKSGGYIFPKVALYPHPLPSQITCVTVYLSHLLNSDWHDWVR